MSKRILALTLCLILLLAPATALCLDTGVDDAADLLTDSEEAALQTDLDALAEQYDIALYVATADDTGGKSSQAYADDAYDAKAPGRDGALLLIDMDNRLATISTSGRMIDILDDSRIDRTLDLVVARLKNQDYAGAASAFITQSRNYLASGAHPDQYRTEQPYPYASGAPSGSHDSALVDDEPTPGETFVAYASCVLLAGVVALVVMLVIRRRYNRLSRTAAKKNYHVQPRVQVQITGNSVQLTNRYVTRRNLPPPSSSSHSSGGSSHSSSTHTSSSGHTHGGGSRGF